ncbi:MAG: tRNA (guanosine(37)-N1)-methyltransferase TrmD [Rickettsiales bacterium]|nr:tRNA (guanosine(37)-N1)-methyltransferase TrmD [Rickettsiales bacterium]
MHANILTLFPEMFPGALGYSILGRALADKTWSLDTVNLRDFAVGKHANVDETPYGGGAGMLLRADVVGPAIESIPNKGKLLYLSPRGKPLTQTKAVELAQEETLTLLCGRFEGVDQRVLDHYEIEEISIGDYVLAGGEVAAQVVLEAVLRLIPGVLGESASAEEESFGLNTDYAGLLEYPHYTKPPLWNDLEVPEVLLSGHHGNIKKWRKEQAEKLTKARRPDMCLRLEKKEEHDEPIAKD